MVINFNLLLVWLPMCKYTLTKLACLAGKVSSRQRSRLQSLASWEEPQSSNQLAEITCATCPNVNHHQVAKFGQKSNLSMKRLALKLKWSINKAIRRINYWFCMVKIYSIDTFLIAVDHATSLHTICATTITLASGRFPADHVGNSCLVLHNLIISIPYIHCSGHPPTIMNFLLLNHPSPQSYIL